MRVDILEKKELILKLIEDNLPKAEISRILKCKEVTLNTYLKKMEIEYLGNKGGKGYKTSNNKKSAMFYIQNNKRISSHKLKNKLIDDKIKEHKCEDCGLNEWLGSRIPIELHHIDGDRYNNKLENLKILCPNCHAKTENYSGRNKVKENKIENKKIENKKNCICGKLIKKNSKKCNECYNKSQRIVERPEYDKLLNEVKLYGYRKTGRNYSVSDNTIRKWIKYYEKVM